MDERLADCGRRARSLQQATRLAAQTTADDPVWQPNERLLTAFAQVADRIAFDLAVIERDRALEGAA